jgi:hypothetical protein
VTLNEWKSLEITQVIMSELKLRQAQLRLELGQSAGIDPLDDRHKAGVIAAYEDILNIELEESHN